MHSNDSTKQRREFFERIAQRVRCVKRPRGQQLEALCDDEGVLLDVGRTKATVRFDRHGVCRIVLQALEPVVSLQGVHRSGTGELDSGER